MNETTGHPGGWNAVVLPLPLARASLEEAIAWIIAGCGLIAFPVIMFLSPGPGDIGGWLSVFVGSFGVAGLILVVRGVLIARSVWRARRSPTTDGSAAGAEAGVQKIARILAWSIGTSGRYRLKYRRVREAAGGSEMPTVLIEARTARVHLVASRIEDSEFFILHAAWERVAPIMIPVLLFCALGALYGISRIINDPAGNAQNGLERCAVAAGSFIVAGTMIAHWWRYARLRLVIRDGRSTIMRGRREVGEIDPTNTVVVASTVWTLATKDFGTFWFPFLGAPVTGWGDCAHAAMTAWRSSVLGERCFRCGYVLDGVPPDAPCPGCGFTDAMILDDRKVFMVAQQRPLPHAKGRL